MLVGAVKDPSQLDRHGWAAGLEVERVLAGTLADGAHPRMAWEELAAGRPVRFGAGDRIAVALEPLPPGSLWGTRFPQRDALAVAARGAAFLRDPDPSTVARLAAFLALPTEERDATAGVAALAALVAEAEPATAHAAVARLDRVPGLAGRTTDPATRALTAALAAGGTGDARPVALRAALLGLIGRRGLTSLAGEVERLAAAPGPLQAPALDAWLVLASAAENELGGVSPEHARERLESPDAAVRAVVVRRAGGSLGRDRVAALVTGDPDARVRAAAVETLVRAHGISVFDLAAPALFDPDASVRATAARELGALGAVAVPGLERLARSRSGPEAAGPLAALTFAGPEGQARVRELARSHPDAQTRRLAALMLGRPGEVH